LGQALKNPDNDPKEILAYEMIHHRRCAYRSTGRPASSAYFAHRTGSAGTRSSGAGLEMEPPQYMPHAPEQPVQAKVVSALGGPLYAGAWMTLVLDKGARDGIEEGHVLALFRPGRSVADPKCIRAEKIAFLAGGGRGHAEDCKKNENDMTALAGNAQWLAFVYRVFNKVAYALVMKTASNRWRWAIGAQSLNEPLNVLICPPNCRLHPDAHAWLTLEAIPGLGPDAAQRLFRAFDLPADILAAHPAQLEALVGRTLARAINQGVDAAALQPGLDWLAQPDNHLITWNDPAYPARFARFAGAAGLALCQG
jgi:hypothetical protein